MDLSGLYPAVVLPMTPDESIDEESFTRLLEHAHTPAQVSGLVVNGHAGELLLIDHDERERAISIARALLPNDRAVISGVVGITPRELADDAERATEAGAEALLVVPPFDVRPIRSLVHDVGSALLYFEAIAERVDTPLIVFQYSKSSGCAYPLDVLEAVCDLPTVLGVKAGTRDITDYVALYERVAGKVAVLAASDGPPLLPMLLHGAAGALIGVSQIGAPIWAQLVDAALGGREAEAVDLFRRACLPITTAVYENQQPTSLVSSVAATKTALTLMGVIDHATVRRPLIGPDGERTRLIKSALDTAGLLD